MIKDTIKCYQVNKNVEFFFFRKFKVIFSNYYTLYYQYKLIRFSVKANASQL